MAASKADRERDEYRREARTMFGMSAKVSGVTHAVQQPMGMEFQESNRLAAVHDPTKPSGCRICGRTTEGEWVEVSGWKVCAPCAELLPGGLGAVMTELLGMTVSETEAFKVLQRVPCDNPSFFVRRWATDPGQERPWAHVDAGVIHRATEVLAELRAETVPRRNTFNTGCSWCGVSRSTSWTETSWRIGRGPQAPRVAACADCWPWVERSGACSEVYDDWRPYLLACCTGMDHPQWGFDFGLKSFFESDPADPSGTDEHWEYLGPLRGELRMRVASVYPRLVVLTEHEKRVLALQRAAADTGQPAQRTPLARL